MRQRSTALLVSASRSNRHNRIRCIRRFGSRTGRLTGRFLKSASPPFRSGGRAFGRRHLPPGRASRSPVSWCGSNPRSVADAFMVNLPAGEWFRASRGRRTSGGRPGSESEPFVALAGDLAMTRPRMSEFEQNVRVKGLPNHSCSALIRGSAIPHSTPTSAVRLCRGAPVLQIYRQSCLGSASRSRITLLPAMDAGTLIGSPSTRRLLAPTARCPATPSGALVLTLDARAQRRFMKNLALG
jgi:hypothetical protein